MVVYLIEFVIFAIVSFGFGILTVKDRIFGIIGILVGFIGASQMYIDSNLVINSICDPTQTPCVWTNQIQSSPELIWIDVGIIVLDFVILYAESENYKPIIESY